MTVKDLQDILATLPSDYEILRHDGEYGGREIDGVTLEQVITPFRRYVWTDQTVEDCEAGEQIQQVCYIR